MTHIVVDWRRNWSVRPYLAAHAALLGFTLVALSLWYVRDAVVPWDSKNQFYPLFRFLSGSLAEGEIPFWNPYHFGGHPTVADPQSGLFTPSIFAFALLLPNASMQAFDAFIMAHLFAGGVGVLALFRRRGWSAPGGVLAAIIFMLGGPAAKGRANAQSGRCPSPGHATGGDRGTGLSRPRFLADNDLMDQIVLGVQRREPALQIIRLRDVGLEKAADAVVLEYAAQTGAIVVSHDVNTMTAAAVDRIEAGREMAGLLLVHQQSPVAATIDDLIVIWIASDAAEWNNDIRFLPL